MRGIVNDVLERLLESSPAVSSTQLAGAAGISRQAAHKRLKQLVAQGALLVSGKARAARYRWAHEKAPALPLRQRLDVDSAGSLYRLSARLLLADVVSGEVTLDFTGVVDVGEEFLEEVFLVWAPAHPRVSLRVEHLPARFAPMLLDLAKAVRAQASEREAQAQAR